jgi:predicted O-linked N-acetylglucosamine transferase (SPINDLY family)
MYVGSAGASYLPVMFADRIVLPPELAPDVSEKVVVMPETFYFNSHSTSFASIKAASCLKSDRRRWNLPKSGVVLLNHNQFYKFDRFSFYTMLASQFFSYRA